MLPDKSLLSGIALVTAIIKSIKKMKSQPLWAHLFFFLGEILTHRKFYSTLTLLMLSQVCNFSSQESSETLGGDSQSWSWAAHRARSTVSQAGSSVGPAWSALLSSVCCRWPWNPTRNQSISRCSWACTEVSEDGEGEICQRKGWEVLDKDVEQTSP